MQKVTVIIPYRKDRGWLQEAIDSVPGWCELVVEQGDANKSILFNRALEKATGEIIKVLDEDDMLIEDGLKMQADALRDYDIIHANAIYIDSHGHITGRYIPRVKHPTLQDILKKNTLHNPSMIYRRSVFEALGGYDETLPKSQDYEYHLRCLSAGMTIGYCDSFVVYYRLHQEQITNTMTNVNNMIKKQIRKGYDTTCESE